MAGRQSFVGVVRAKQIELHTLTSTWVTSAITVAITVLFGAGLIMSSASSPDRANQTKTVIIAGSVLGMIAVAVLGALMITGEYTSGQVRSSVVAVPRRGHLFVTKALAGSAFSFVLGVLNMVLAYTTSYPFMKDHTGFPTDAYYLGLLWGTGLPFTIISLMAQGVGHLTRSAVGVITMVVSALFVIPLPFQMMTGYWERANKVLGPLPDILSTAVSDPFSLATRWGQAGTATFLQHWQAVAALAAQTIIPMVIAAVVFTRHDV